jgi:hypothetical protein
MLKIGLQKVENVSAAAGACQKLDMVLFSHQQPAGMKKA